MPHPTPNPHHPSPWLAAFCGVTLLLSSCSSEKPVAADPPPAPTPPHPAETALAARHIDANRPDLALAVLAAHPDHPTTRQILDQTRWHLPTTRLDHPGYEIHHLAIHRNALWVGLANDPFHTLVRWNLDTRKIEAVLFPTRDPLRHFVLSPSATHAVVTRGDVSLLVDAHTLKPIADIDEIPHGITPESTLVFSPDTLLFAHPAHGAWHIRDTATGQSIRIIETEELPPSPVLAAHLESGNLRLLTRDGTRIDIPVSPIEPIAIHPFEDEPLEILHAHLIHHGNTAIIIRDLGPHEPPAAIEFDLVDRFPHHHFSIDAWAAHQSHSDLPGLATGLLRHLDPPPVEFTESAVIFHGHPQAPIPTESPPVAIASDINGTLAVAETHGRITLFKPIPTPEKPTPDTLTTLARHQYHPETGELSSWDGTSQSVEGTSCPLTPLHHRLTDALPYTLTPNLPAHTLATAFQQNDTATLIDILESEPNLPPTLRTLAISHIHFHQNRTASAFTPYHNGFPNIHHIRQREDWHGWEQPDFQPAVDTLEHAYLTVLADLTIDPESEETARHRTIARLLDPATIDSLGRARYAAACLDAAKALITIAGEAEHAFTLATVARYHGAPAAACLRIEAMALIALEKFAEAHTRWISLIADYPATDHLPDDYTEAAYTAFENADPRQSIEILITGVHRFGHNPEFALRAAWIALLTGNAGQARAFLLKGQAAGFPEDGIEHATVLLTIAAALDQDAPAANAHFQDLLAIDPTWADPQTLDTLPWPEHLIEPLRGLMW